MNFPGIPRGSCGLTIFLHFQGWAQPLCGQSLAGEYCFELLRLGPRTARIRCGTSPSDFDFNYVARFYSIIQPSRYSNRCIDWNPRQSYALVALL
jgi:hypothetical protein